MSDLAKVAGAVEEIAKASGKALDVVHDTGGYLAKVLGGVPGNLVGVLGGAWLCERHIRLKDGLRRRTEQILRQRDVQQLVELSPNLASALIAGAQEEGREELAELWARLLANAIDPSMNSVRHSFIEAVKAFDPPDVIVLHHVYERSGASIQPGSDDDGGRPYMYVGGIANALNMREDFIQASIDHLSALGFFERRINTSIQWLVTSTNREFMRACYPEVETTR